MTYPDSKDLPRLAGSVGSILGASSVNPSHLPRTPRRGGAAQRSWGLGSWGLLVSLVSLVTLAGCGRPATEQECEEIVDRIARLAATSQGSERAEVVEQLVQEAKEKARKDKTMELCVGNRVTESAMTCVRQATTAENVKKCFQ